jgi:hypothetical protein
VGNFEIVRVAAHSSLGFCLRYLGLLGATLRCLAEDNLHSFAKDCKIILTFSGGTVTLLYDCAARRR